MMVIELEQRFTHRSRIGIMAKLLADSVDGSRKTRLIYRDNLSFAQFKKKKRGLPNQGGLLQMNVEIIRGMKGYELYPTTEKGIEFLKDYKMLSEILSRS